MAEGNHDTSSPEESTLNSPPELVTEKNNAQSSKQNFDGSNKTIDTIAGAAGVPELPNQPIFVAPNLDAVKQANPYSVLGKTSGGGIIYISSNPSAESEAATQETGIQELSTSQSSDIYQQQRETAFDAIDSVKDRGTQAQQNLTDSSSDNIAQIDSQIASSVTQTQSAIAAQKVAIAKVMQTSRTSVTDQSEQTILTIEGQYNQTLSSIDARTASAQQKLSANRKRLDSQIERNYDTFTRRIDSAIATTKSAFEREYGRTITAIERTSHGYVKQYSRELPKRSSNLFGNLVEKIGWGTYVTNWRNAKIEATKKVAEGFRVSTTEAFNNNLATLEQYHESTIEGGRQFAKARQQSIAALDRQTQQALFQQAAAAKARAKQTYKQQIAYIRNQQAQKLQQINAQQAQYNATLDSKGGEAIAEIQKLGGVLRLSLRGAIFTGQANLARAVSGFESGLSESDDPKAQAGAIVAAQAAKAALDEAFEDAQYDINTASTNALAQIKTTTGDILFELSGVAQTASGQQASSLAAYSLALKHAIAQASSSFDSMLAGTSQMLDRTVDKSVLEWNPIDEQMVESLIRVEVNLGKQLTLSETQVIAQRESIMTKLGAEVRSKSKEEASKVQPAWKKVVKLVVNIGISVATTVAIAALAMSGVGLVALIGLSALIGAAGGVAKLAANNLIDGTTSSALDYLKAGGIGAATGILEGLGGRAVVGVGGKLGAQMLTKIEHMVASTGIEAVTNTLVELTEAMGQGQDFTLKLLGISILSSLLSTAGGKYIDVKFSDIGKGTARGATREGTQQGYGLAAAQFATETAFDTGVETGASVARGEELTIESFGENLAGGVLGRGAAGRADKLYGNKLRGLGNNRDGDVNSQTGERRNDSVNGNNANRTGGENNKGSSNTLDNTTRNNPNSDTPSSDTSPRQPVPTQYGRNREFERVASVGLSRRVVVMSDPDLYGNTVRAEYKLNSRGVVQDVHLRAGLGATANDIKLHQHTVKVMRMYGGTLGKVRLVEAKIAKWIGMHGQPQTGTRAWEAQHEIPKLNSVISDRLQTLETAEPDEAQRLEAEVKQLSDQLKEHQSTFEIQNESEGVGYIAARGVKRKPEEITLLREKAPTELKAQLEQPPVGVLTKQEIGQWLWRTENRNADPSTMPKNLTARADILIKQWQKQGLEVYLVDGKVIFDKSVYEQYSSKKTKKSEEEYVSPYKESMYGDSEKIDIADGWSFKTGEIISTADKVAEETIGKTSSNQTDTVQVNPQKLGDAANKIDDFAYDRASDKPYSYGEGRKYRVGKTENGTAVGYKHYRQKFNEFVDVGRIGDLESGRGIDYNRLPKEIKQQLQAEGINVDGKDGAYVGKQLTKLMNGKKLPDGKSSQTITELYGLWFAKEPSHPWEFSRETGKSKANYDHKRDLVYSKMITQLMASDKIQTLQEALNLHPATYGGAQEGARKVTEEMNGRRMPKDQTRVREKRDERYRREKETIQKWFEMHKEQFQNKGEEPTLENLEKFIKENI